MLKSAEQKRSVKSKYILIGSTEAYSGKSATILIMARQLQEKGLDIAYGKPLGTGLSVSSDQGLDEDVQFLSETLKLQPDRLGATLVFLQPEALEKRMRGEDTTDYTGSFLQSLEEVGGEVLLLEGPANMEEGSLFGLSLPEMAELIDASVLLVSPFESLLGVDVLLSAKERLGDRLIGVLLNDIDPKEMAAAKTITRPFLEERGIPVLAMLPRSALLRSVSVGELAKRLNAEVLCRADKLDLMVESLKIGAMNVNSALKYLFEGENMAVVTGGDRTEIQLAALETSTQCLILTGHLPPAPMILKRAEEAEVPVLSVDLDTLSTVEIINSALGHVRLHEPMKVNYMGQLMAEHFALDRLLAAIGLEPALA